MYETGGNEGGGVGGGDTGGDAAENGVEGEGAGEGDAGGESGEEGVGGGKPGEGGAGGRGAGGGGIGTGGDGGGERGGGAVGTGGDGGGGVGNGSDGGELPAWEAGAHIDVVIGQFARSYSLAGDPADRSAWRIAVLRDDQSRGGSAAPPRSPALGSRSAGVIGGGILAVERGRQWISSEQGARLSSADELPNSGETPNDGAGAAASPTSRGARKR